LLQKQEAAVIHALEIVVDVLGKRENEHKMKFKGKTVTSIFPGQLSYFFEKIFEGTISDNSGRWEWGRLHVESLIEVVGKLREAFVERAVLPASDVIERELQDTNTRCKSLRDITIPLRTTLSTTKMLISTRSTLSISLRN